MTSLDLQTGVLYQIYPQSFADADGDGIGDLPGIVAALDHLAWLGVGAIWLSPCFASPFADAGYDVADFTRIAPRYGTEEDLRTLTREAGARGIAVLLDLVAGHTSDTHPWFRDEPDRYIRSDVPADGFVPGPGGADWWYLPNFFACQPALNYGYAREDPAEPWRQDVDAPGPRANRKALRDIMSFWFDRGVAGFRVDMAASLVKDDPGHVETRKLWTQLRDWIEATYPGRVLIAEWGDPATSVPAGFHADFLLQFGGEDDGLPWRSLWNNGVGTVHEHWNQKTCWADAAGRGTTRTFVTAWRRAAAAIAAGPRPGVVGLPTANHDVTRPVAGPRDADQARIVTLLTLTWAALPSLYYGEEIGMRYVEGVGPLEGSSLGPRYERAGSRTPMPWGGAETARESRYLPQDPRPDRPTVADQRIDPSSLLAFTRAVIGLRSRDDRLRVDADLDVLHHDYPFVYVRGGSLVVALNPSGARTGSDLTGIGAARVVLERGLHRGADRLDLDPFGYAVLDQG
ncbi:alpha-amylase family glycosyl hydrolase [Kineococcus gynurae]|uniref:Alpha-amylase family glycosyl hydrolase n=1 Tax=Kineococcus gynurae TaxID=452979 RepID=A0ABV5LXQ1_9ACTN